MNELELTDLTRAIEAPDPDAAEAGRQLQAQLTKPAGSLGYLEPLGIQLCAIARTCPPPVPASVTIGVFAGDHGVLAEGVSPWPMEVTAQMVANFCAGGAAINVLARHVGATVVIVDVGVATPIPGDGGRTRSPKRRSRHGEPRSRSRHDQRASTPSHRRRCGDSGRSTEGRGANARDRRHGHW